jgi:hypothetical protein
MNRYSWAFAAVVFAALIVDAPMLGISFVGDDALRANIDGWLAVHHANLLDAFRAELFGEDFSSGRFHPLFIALTLFQMHLVHQPIPLKLAQLFAVGLNVATVAFVVFELTGSASRALVVAVFSVLTLQIRNVYDATNGDTLHLQATLECGLLAVGLFAYSLRQRGLIRWISYGMSILSFTAALLFYELMTPLILALLLLSAGWSRAWARHLALSLPFVAVLAADVVVLVAVRHTWPQAAGSFYAANYGPSYIYAVLFQAVSTVPFLYEFVDPQNVFHATGTYWPFAVLAALAALSAAAGWALARERAGGEAHAEARVVIVALATGLALLAPAVIVAASPLYQQAIRFGLPYAPVYFQGFGLAIIAAVCLPRRYAPPASLRLLGVACALSLLVLFASNAVVAGELATSGYARRTIVGGLVHRAASDVPIGALVFLDHSYSWVNDNSYYGMGETARGPVLWDSMYFYRLWSGRTWRTRPLSTEKLRAGEEAYEIRSIANDANRGTLIVEKVRGRARGLSPVIADAAIYERGVPTDSPAVPAVASAFAADDFTLVNHGANWRLSAFHPHCDALPNDALIANAPSAARIIYGDGFYVAEDDGKVQWRWAGPLADLALVNETASPLVTDLRAPIETVGPARGTVIITSPAGRQRIEVSDHAQTIHMSASLPPRSRVAIHFEADAPNVALAGDWRDLRYRVVDATLTDRIGCGAEDAAWPAPRWHPAR